MVEAVSQGARGGGESAGRRAPGAKRARGVGVVQCLLTSLMLGIGVEWIGMVAWWPGEGSGHAREVMLTERGYLAEDFRIAATYVGDWAERGYYWLFQWTRIEDALAWGGGRAGLGEFVRAALYQVQVLIGRVCTLAVSVPVFGLFALVGAVCGLVLRDIRRWSAGREFGAVYHASKRWSPRLLAVAAVIYLAVPVATHPTTVMIPGAVAFGLTLMVVTASFKKYL